MPKRVAGRYDSDSDFDDSEDEDFEYDPEDDVDFEIEHEKRALRLELRAPFDPLFSRAQIEKLKNEPAAFELSPSKQKRPNNQARLDVSMFAPIPSTTVLSKFLRRPSPPDSGASSPRDESEVSVEPSPVPVRKHKATKRAETDLPQRSISSKARSSRYAENDDFISDSEPEESSVAVSDTSSIGMAPPKGRAPLFPRPPSLNTSTSSPLIPLTPETPITERIARRKTQSREHIRRARANS